MLIYIPLNIVFNLYAIIRELMFKFIYYLYITYSGFKQFKQSPNNYVICHYPQYLKKIRMCSQLSNKSKIMIQLLNIHI